MQTQTESATSAQSTPVSLKTVARILLTRGSLLHFCISVLFALSVLCTYVWGFAPVTFFTEHFVACLTFMTCVVLIFSSRERWDGFFLIVGLGYGFFGILRVFYLISFPYDPNASSQQRNLGTQFRFCCWFVEASALICGIALAHRTFRNMRAFAIPFILYLLFSLFLLFSVLWWKIFPDCVDPVTHSPTVFKKVVEWMYPFFLLAVFIGIAFRRNVFAVDVFTYLMIGFAFRAASAFLSMAVTPFEPHSVNIVGHLFRLIGFSYIFSVMGISTLKQPTKTLFRNLEYHQRALQKEKVFAEWIIEQVPAMLLLLNHNGVITYSNEPVQQVFKMPRGEVIGKKFFEFFVADGQGDRVWHDILNSSLDHSMKLRTDQVFTIVTPSPKGSQMIEWKLSILKTEPVTSSTPVEGDIELGDLLQEDFMTVLCLGQDITDTHQREGLLMQAKNEAQQLSDMKDTFIANVSHELRTPLNCIVGVTSLLLGSCLDSHQLDMVGMISSAANTLLEVITDILDLNSIKQGRLKLTMSEINLRNFIEDTIFSVSLLPQVNTNNLDVGYRVMADCPITIISDEKRLRQVLMNLLSNAIKFTAHGQVILLCSLVLENSMNFLEVKVMDSGIGIKAEDLKYLFQRFSQLDHTFTRKFQGTGIGLHFSKQLVEMLGGSIGVESVYGKGSTFWFRIPIGTTGPTATPTLTSVAPTHKALVLLGNRTMGQLVEWTLKFDHKMEALVVENISELQAELRKFLSWDFAERLAVWEGRDRPREWWVHTLPSPSFTPPCSPMISPLLLSKRYYSTQSISIMEHCAPPMSTTATTTTATTAGAVTTATAANGPTTTTTNTTFTTTPTSSTDTLVTINRQGDTESVLTTTATATDSDTDTEVALEVRVQREREIPSALSGGGGGDLELLVAPKLSIIVESDCLPKLDLDLLGQLVDKGFSIEITCTSPNPSVPVHVSIQQHLIQLGVHITTIGKPIKMSSLIHSLFAPKDRQDLVLEAQYLDPDHTGLRDRPHRATPSRGVASAAHVDVDVGVGVGTSSPTTSPQRGKMTGSIIKKKILLVEDNVVNQKVANMMLKKVSCVQLDVVVASNGAEAVFLFSKDKFDVILMDCQMPVMDGYTATAEIRKLESHQLNRPRTIIIAMTANALEEDREKCLSVGMDDYISKPVKLETLEQKMASLFLS